MPRVLLALSTILDQVGDVSWYKVIFVSRKFFVLIFTVKLFEGHWCDHKIKQSRFVQCGFGESLLFSLVVQIVHISLIIFGWLEVKVKQQGKVRDLTLLCSLRFFAGA